MRTVEVAGVGIYAAKLSVLIVVLLVLVVDLLEVDLVVLEEVLEALLVTDLEVAINLQSLRVLKYSNVMHSMNDPSS